MDDINIVQAFEDPAIFVRAVVGLVVAIQAGDFHVGQIVGHQVGGVGASGH